MYTVTTTIRTTDGEDVVLSRTTSEDKLKIADAVVGMLATYDLPNLVSIVLEHVDVTTPTDEEIRGTVEGPGDFSAPTPFQVGGVTVTYRDER